MESRREELIKLAARVTTAAGDVSAVSGTSISEILDFMQENLNVDENGALVVSNIFNNLLSGEFTLEENGTKYVLTNRLGLEVGKQYILRVMNMYLTSPSISDFTLECTESTYVTDAVCPQIRLGTMQLTSRAGIEIIDQCSFDGSNYTYSPDSCVIKAYSSEGYGIDAIIKGVSEA